VGAAEGIVKSLSGIAELGALTAPLVADAMVRLDLPIRIAPLPVRPLRPGMRLTGRARPVRHFGSVDVFLEAIEQAQAGDVLVIDNGDRNDEGCIGDLAALEAKAAGLAGAIVWGRHRDTAELLEIGWPIFSTGACAVGPRELRPRERDAFEIARIGTVEVRLGDVIHADDDAVLVLSETDVDRIVEVAAQIARTERGQADRVRSGESLRSQLRFSDYLTVRREQPTLTFREHLIRDLTCRHARPEVRPHSALTPMPIGQLTPVEWSGQ
jgi:4-hydroxy-4-methyl-2-oxoglutarate aldolase